MEEVGPKIKKSRKSKKVIEKFGVRFFVLEANFLKEHDLGRLLLRERK